MRHHPARCSMTVAYGVPGPEYAHGDPGVISSIPSVRQCGRPVDGSLGYCERCEREFADEYPGRTLTPAWGGDVVAVIRDRDGDVIDYAYSVQTARSMVINGGYLATAVADDGPITRVEADREYEYLADLYADCWLA